MRYSRLAASALLILLGPGLRAIAHAQQSTPAETVGRQFMETLPQDSSAVSDTESLVPRWATAAELSYGIGLYANRLSEAAPSGGASAWRDTVRAAVAARTRAWLAQLDRATVRGIQLDPMGQLFVAVGNEAQAVAQFDQRLATPGLPLADRIYTYQIATFAFHDLDKPKRLAIAQRYFDRLMALPVEEAGRAQFATLAGFARQYDLRGRSRDVIDVAARAYVLVGRMPFIDRMTVFNSGLYLLYADALAGVSGGRARLDTLNTALLAATVPPASLVAQDSAYLWTGNEWAKRLKNDIAMTASLGTRAAPIVAHRWFNTTQMSTTDTSWTPTQLSLDDGKIRLIEFGDRYCGYCMLALPAMDRLHHAFKDRGVEVWYVTNTYGIWNTTFVDRAEEVSRLKEYYALDKKVTLPIALWAGEKQMTEDEGLVPQESPNAAAYHLTSRPIFYLIDGRGFVRHISRGFSSNGADEPRLRDRIERLLQEAAAKQEAH